MSRGLIHCVCSFYAVSIQLLCGCYEHVGSNRKTNIGTEIVIMYKDPLHLINNKLPTFPNIKKYIYNSLNTFY